MGEIVIDGNPAGVEAAADTIATAGRDLTTTAEDIASHGREVTSQWVGVASDAAGDHIARLSHRAHVGADVLASVPGVLRAYASELRAAQQMWVQASVDAGVASTAAQSAQNDLDSLGAPPGLHDVDATHQQATTTATAALGVALAAGQAAQDVMADALARAQRADDVAARAIHTLTDQLTAMGDPTTSHSVEHGNHHWYDTAWHGIETFAHVEPRMSRDAIGAVGETAWQSGPGAIAALAHHSPFADDRAYADDIDHAHDWLQKTWGTDTHSHTFTYVGDATNVVGFITTDSESGLGAGVREAGAASKAAREARAGQRIGEGAEGAAALSAAQRARVAALPARYRSLDVLTEQAGQKGAWNKALYKPEANKVYLVDDRHTFVTDAKGRVEHVQSDLQYRDPTDVQSHRHGGQQTAAGGTDRLEFDQGGHLVAASLGGPGEGINLVAMHKELNGAANEATWGAMEKQLRTLLKEDPSADIKFRVDITYDDSTRRPAQFDVRYSVDGAPSIKREFLNGK